MHPLKAPKSILHPNTVYFIQDLLRMRVVRTKSILHAQMARQFLSMTTHRHNLPQYASNTQHDADLMRFVIMPPATAPLHVPGGSHELAISPDGTLVVYQSAGESGQQLNLRPIDQLVGAPLRGTDGGDGPFFSPDGECSAATAGAYVELS